MILEDIVDKGILKFGILKMIKLLIGITDQNHTVILSAHPYILLFIDKHYRSIKIYIQIFITRFVPDIIKQVVVRVVNHDTRGMCKPKSTIWTFINIIDIAIQIWESLH